MALHATLAMLPGTASIAGRRSAGGRPMRLLNEGRGKYTGGVLFTSKPRVSRLNKGYKL